MSIAWFERFEGTSRVLKRAFDLLFSALGLVVLSPVFAYVAWRIKRDSPGPLLFRQERVGRHGRVFRIHKFRTMTVQQADAGPQITVGLDGRITRIGHTLRRYKLDELPQLIDVLVGSMSFVGPRPEVPMYVAHYPEDIRRVVLSVRPGITDLASIEYRNENDLLGRADDPERTYIEEVIPAKLGYCVDYVKRQGFFFDLQIIFRTFRALSQPHALSAH
jgi:lipopolysaccharide/colanic/teichoic acid biosynthesis glycosyltransferase